jgi:hypothetical protein
MEAAEDSCFHLCYDFFLAENYVLCYSSDLSNNFQLADIIHVTALIYVGTSC